MSFGMDLSKEFYRFTSRIFSDEVTLFTKLEDSFINLKTIYPNYSLDIIHGAKSFVEFEYNGTYISTITTPQLITRELADMFFITFSPSKKEIRLMYMQNKKGTKVSTFPDKFKADLLQLYLLHERCEIKSRNLPDCVFGDRKILTNAILPSVGSYGVFYWNTIIDQIDMAYFPANRLTPQNPGRSKVRMVMYDSSNYGVENKISGFIESQGERDLAHFGDSLYNMKIGTPISTNDEIYKPLTAFLKKNSIVFRESAFPVNYDNNLQNNEYDNTLDKLISLAIVINTDR